MTNITEVDYGGREQLTMKQYETLETEEPYTDYDIIDYPVDGITNEQMKYALTCTKLFPLYTLFACMDEGTYHSGHIYQMQLKDGLKVWVDISPSTTIIKNNITVSNWVEDTTYVNFGFKADIEINGLTENDVCEVIFNQTEASSGNYTQVNLSSENKLTIYSKVNTEIIIPTIIIMKG